MRRWSWLAVAMAGLVLVPAAQAATTFTVTTTADDATGVASHCTVAPATACSLRDAVAAANATPGSSIALAAQPYRLTHGQLNVTASTTIAGQGSASTEIEQQTSGSRVMAITPPTSGASVTISGVEITGGTITGTVSAAAAGGGVLVNPSAGGLNVTLSGDLITQNLATGATATAIGTKGGAADGAGIDVASTGTPSMTLVNTSVSGNTARAGSADSANSTAANGAAGGKADGGGIDFTSTGTLTVSGGAISGNFAIGGDGEPVANTAGLEAGDGGAAQAGGLDVIGTLSVTGTAIENDVAESGDGGGAAGSNAEVSPGGTAFGGGLVAEASATISQAEITGDQIQLGSAGSGGASGFAVQGEGGGVALGNNVGDDGGDVTITDSTIAGDAANAPSSAIGVGGGLANVEADRLTIVNSTIEGNVVQGSAFGEGGFGGGLALDGTTTLASDTISGNRTQTGGVGGNIQAQSATVSVTNTIVADGAGPAIADGDNCNASLGTIEDLPGNGHNLESDAGGECGFTATGDLHAEPQLGSLALNGGVTETMLPASTSPMLGAGGACIDPTSSARLAADERSQPRPTGTGACDMGAVQVQAPSNMVAPAITGTAAVGDTLTCGTGTWTGDGTLTFADQWRRGTTAITSGSTYTIVAADEKQPVSCIVTASSAYGANSASSAAVTVPVPTGASTPRPKVLNFRESAGRWRVAGKAAKHKPPVGTRFSFTLNEAATVTLTFTQAGHGRRLSGKCRTQTAKNRKKPSCVLTLTRGTIKLAGRSGKNSVRFTGRLSNRHTLKPGKYSVTITAKRANAAGSKPVTLRFTIVT